MKRNFVLMASVGLSMLVACSSATTGGAAASAPVTRRADNAQLLRWSGTFQPSQQQTGSLTPHSTNKTFGNVTLTRLNENPNSVRAKIELSTPLTDSRQVHWAVFDGRCASGTLPLLAIEQFPQINITNNGRGQLDADVPLALVTTGSYHVDVYWTTGRDQGDVMTCANLRLDATR